jgi:predicted RNase H-like HicB family nuclease
MSKLTLDELVQLPWTRRGPLKDSQAGEEFYKITIDELPAFVVVGSTPYEVITNADRTLRVFLSSRLDNGLPIPMPGQPAPAASPPPTPGAPVNPLLTPRAKSGPVPLPKRTGTSPAPPVRPAADANPQRPLQSGPVRMPNPTGTNTAPASPPPNAPKPSSPAPDEQLRR